MSIGEQPKTRGRTYPGHSLEESIGNTERTQQQLGDGPFSRESIAEALGQTLSGSSMVKIGAMTHYGLLAQRTGVYEVSSLGRAILFPRTAEEKDAAICDAVRSPALYSELFDRFVGKPIPSLLPNILTREFGIQAKAAQKCADIFLKSVTFARLFRNGVLHAEPLAQGRKTSVGDAHASKHETAPVERGHSDSDAGSYAPVPNGRIFTMPLSGQRTVSISVPAHLKSADVHLIKQWIDLMEPALVDGPNEFDSLDVDDESDEENVAPTRNKRMPR